MSIHTASPAWRELATLDQFTTHLSAWWNKNLRHDDNPFAWDRPQRRYILTRMVRLINAGLIPLSANENNSVSVDVMVPIDHGRADAIRARLTVDSVATIHPHPMTPEALTGYVHPDVADVLTRNYQRWTVYALSAWDRHLIWDRLDDLARTTAEIDWATLQSGSEQQQQAAWSRVDTPRALGELIARWLTGDQLNGTSQYNPQYGGFGTPDPETVSIAAPLAQLNRLGAVTIGSQPGQRDETGEQRAQVDLFADVHRVDNLAAAVDDTNRIAGATIVHMQHHPVCQPGAASVATRAPISRTTDGQVTAYCGYQLTRREIADMFNGELCEAMIDRLAEMRQVTIHSEHWGVRSEPWDTIETAIDRLWL